MHDPADLDATRRHFKEDEMAGKTWMQGAAASLLALAGCGGGGGVNTTPPPIAGPTPTPTPAPTPTPPATLAPIPAPADTTNPLAPVASAGGPTLANAAADTNFPLLQVAVDGDFAGDVATTSQGATINLDGNGRRGLTINNEALGVIDATATTERRTVNGYAVFGAPLPGGRNLQVGEGGGLDYTLYGYWLIMNEPPDVPMQGGGAWLGGFVTAPGAVPTSGGAVFNGAIIGLYEDGYKSAALVGGVVRIDVDFAARSVSGAMTGIGLGSDTFSHGPINDIVFSATIDAGANLFRGTTRVSTVPGGPSAFAADAAGTIAGRFFGPAAQEVGGVWTLSDASHHMIGAFGAKR
jgi:hypothetical protein